MSLLNVYNHLSNVVIDLRVPEADIKSAMLYQLSYRPDRKSGRDSYCNARSTAEASCARPAPTSEPR
jgi:hypothetical protein